MKVKYEVGKTVKKGIVAGLQAFMATEAGTVGAGFPLDSIETHSVALISSLIIGLLRASINYFKNK